MLENALREFCDSIFAFVTGEQKSRKSLLVKKHSEYLQKLGDFSFPNTVQSWQGFIDSEKISASDGTAMLQIINKSPADLVMKSENWKLPIKNVLEVKDRLNVFLIRPFAIKVGLLEGLRNNATILSKISVNLANIRMDPLCENEKSITSLRLHCLTHSIQILYSICELQEDNLNIFVTSKSSSKFVNGTTILCGTVLNASTGVKEINITADDFIKLRQNEMTLIAQHKYGVRVTSDSKWQEFIDHLGESAVVFELLQTKPGGAVKINFEHSAAGSSKGASFILYNCARLETMMRTFNEKVEDGTYPPLPDVDSIDFHLLTQEEEWILVFNYILGLPFLLENCVEINNKVCDFRPHHICSFLSSMVRVFSQYYRKTRVLTEARKHLLPVMYARIHMLKVLNETLKTCLRILNIKSVSQM